MTADPIKCAGCGAILNVYSVLCPGRTRGAGAPGEAGAGTPGGAGAPGRAGTVAVPEGHSLWQCEFCNHPNVVQVEEGEIPRTYCSEFLLSPPVSTGAPTPMVVFCIDISGSMCVTTEVEGRVNLHPRAVVHGISDTLQAFTEGQNQWLPGQSKNVTYISRLQCVQSAVHRELESLKKQGSHKPVLITFNHEVSVYHSGDQPRVITGDHLNDFEYLYKEGRDPPVPIKSTTQDSVEVMIDRVYGLVEGGATALCPALVYAVGLVSKAPGSLVLVCTDGLANVGIGNLDVEGKSLNQASSPYTQVASLAKENGTIISVISIRGDDCSMEILATLADSTNGEVDIVDPIDLGTNSTRVLHVPVVVATNVEVCLFLMKGLLFENGESKILFNYGNVTSESDQTYSYSPFPEFSPSPHKPTQLLFQAHVVFTKPDGSRYLRVLTTPQTLTNERDIAEKNLSSCIVATHALHESASLAQLGNYQLARVNLISNQRLLQRGMTSKRNQKEYINYICQAEKLDGFMREAQQMDSLLNIENEKIRKEKRDDAAARNIVKMKKVGRGVFEIKE